MRRSADHAARKRPAGRRSDLAAARKAELAKHVCDAGQAGRVLGRDARAKELAAFCGMARGIKRATTKCLKSICAERAFRRSSTVFCRLRALVCAGAVAKRAAMMCSFALSISIRGLMDVGPFSVLWAPPVTKLHSQ